jgi:hypothetical protein
VTLAFVRDVEALYRYYKLQPSTAAAPGVPAEYPPSGWDDAEPAYTEGSTNTLYTVDLTVFCDGTWAYSSVCASSSYEAAKQAYNRAVAASDAASAAQGSADAASADAEAAQGSADAAAQAASGAAASASEAAAGVADLSQRADALGEGLGSLASDLADCREVADAAETKADAQASYAALSTSLSTTRDGLTATIDGVRQTAEGAATVAENVSSWMTFGTGSGGEPTLSLGSSGSDFAVALTNERLAFTDGGATVAYLSNQKLYITQAEVTSELRIGKYAWVPTQSGSHLTLRYTG